MAVFIINLSEIILSGGYMFSETYRIIKFDSAFRINNNSGQIIRMKKRNTSCLIFTISGNIHFTSENSDIFSAKHTPIYIPKGATYKNECISDAESIMFNFIDENSPLELATLPDIGDEVAEIALRELAIADNMHSSFALSILYSLISKFEESTRKQPHLQEALKYINLHYREQSLTLDEIANAIHISRVYLCKLFSSEYGTSPFRYITSVRMRHAAALLNEGASVTDVASEVGYSDIYGFSRAYKRFYGHSPSGVR